MIFLVLVLIIISCGESLMDSAVNTGTPVVESYLQEGSNILTVKVYSMEVYPNAVNLRLKALYQ